MASPARKTQDPLVLGVGPLWANPFVQPGAAAVLGNPTMAARPLGIEPAVGLAGVTLKRGTSMLMGGSLLMQGVSRAAEEPSSGHAISHRVLDLMLTPGISAEARPGFGKALNVGTGIAVNVGASIPLNVLTSFDISVGINFVFNAGTGGTFIASPGIVIAGTSETAALPSQDLASTGPASLSQRVAANPVAARILPFPYVAVIRGLLEKEQMGAARGLLAVAMREGQNTEELASLASLLSPVRVSRSKKRDSDRRQEYDWIEHHSAEYAGQWVAVQGNELVAHSRSLKELLATLKQMHPTRSPLLHRFE